MGGVERVEDEWRTNRLSAYAVRMDPRLDRGGACMNGKGAFLHLLGAEEVVDEEAHSVERCERQRHLIRREPAPRKRESLC